MVILGVDPSIRYTGYAVVAVSGRTVHLFDHKVISLSPRACIPSRLDKLYAQLESVIASFQVTHLVLETPFLGRNPQNFLKLGYVRAILFLLSARKSLRVREFSPSEVKQSLTGSGRASKEQVALLLSRLFPSLSFARLDQTDAIAVALCAAWRT